MMLVMPGNNSNAHKLNREFPGQIGMLFSPSGRRDPKGLPFALDCEMYSAYLKAGESTDRDAQRKHWDSVRFIRTLSWVKKFGPLFVVVPDVVGNAAETLKEFRIWRSYIEIDKGLDVPIAVQDGMTPDDVPDGVTCFVGGKTEWKWRNVEKFAQTCEYVHVGRVNQYRRLWQCHELGVTSVDGTGFFRGDQSQLRGLLAYLRESKGLQQRKVQMRFA